MKRKKIIITAILVAVTCGAWYGYSEYTRKVKDLSKVKPDEEMTAQQLISFFENDELTANQKYLDKIIAVRGRVKAVEKNGRGHYSVILGQPGSMSSVRCSMDSLHQNAVVNLSEGSTITVKGACTGFNSDELLGSDVILNRCVAGNGQ
jgi:hypothetical protein